MQYTEAFKLALQSLWASKMRSILTLLGVVIGVASVIMVVTLTNGAKQFVTAKINTYGADVVTVSKMPETFITIEEYLDFQKRRDVTFDDYRAILSDCNFCQSVGASRSSVGKVVYGTASITAPPPPAFTKIDKLPCDPWECRKVVRGTATQLSMLCPMSLPWHSPTPITV